MARKPKLEPLARYGVAWLEDGQVGIWDHQKNTWVRLYRGRNADRRALNEWRRLVGGT